MVDPRLGILIMMNNYFHDVATAMLLATAASLFVLYRLQEKHADRSASLLFLDASRWLQRIAVASLVWIIVGGIPRAVYYTRFEWANAAGKGQVPALVAKHVMVLVVLVAGSVGWWKLRRRLRSVQERVTHPEAK